MSINPLSLYHSKDLLLHLDVLTNLNVGLLGLCVRITMTLMAIRETADSDCSTGASSQWPDSVDLALVALKMIKSGRLDRLVMSLWCVWSCLGLHWIF